MYKSVLLALLSLHLRDAAAFGSIPNLQNGEEACENKGFGPSECAAVGCCNYGDGFCLSGVGDDLCSDVIPCAAECIAGVCDSPADAAKPECAACMACQQSMNPCAASCPIGTCDSPADAAKPECEACVACQRSFAPSGCAQISLDFIAACDLGQGTNNTDLTRYCSGECNAALTSASTGCDADDAVEASIKTTADDFLGFCSSCAKFFLDFIAACDLGQGTTNTDLTRYCSGECNAMLKSASTSCDANDAVEANIKTTADAALGLCPV